MTNDHHHSLLQAIAAFDIDAVEKFMDDDVLHFQAEKSVAILCLKAFFERWEFSQGDGEITAREISCQKCRAVYGNEVIHNHVILFEIQRVSFAIDILPTKDGLYRLDNCGPFQEARIEGQSYFRFPLFVPKDLLPNFIPDAEYLRLMSVQEEILSQIDNGQVVFWFVEDLTAWLDKYECTLDDLLSQRFFLHAFKRLKDILFWMVFLKECLIAENEYKSANDHYEKLNHADVWEVYEWYKKYHIKSFADITSKDLNLEHLDKGFFTFKDFLPNLRFSAYGHTEFLKYIETIDFAYEVTEEIRKDRLLENIENEWFLEDIDGTQEPPSEI